MAEYRNVLRNQICHFKIINMKTLSSFLFSLLIAGMQLADAAIIYVNDDATGVNNGTSWANAFTSLQSGIAAAVPGDEIWVASGTYKTTTNTNRQVYFTIPNAVALYGGFAGTETQLSQRDWTVNVSTLSADIAIAGVAWDNSYHVVYANNVTASTRIDGFKIVSGYGNAGYLSTDHGGGLYANNSSLTIANCTFIANHADGEGGAVSHWGTGNLNIIDCKFNNNTAEDGGAIAFRGGAFTLTGCDISDNQATRYGGGITVYDGVTTVNRCVFSGNIADYSGAIDVYEYATINVFNSLFAGNQANGIAVMYISEFYNTNYHIFWNNTVANNKASGDVTLLLNYYTVVRNCIFWGNETTYNFDIPNYDVENCIIEDGYFGAPSVSTSNPRFIQPGSGTGAPFNASAYNYRLQSNSPAINSGDNGNVSSSYNYDLDDSTRISGGTVDLGCYERYYCTMNVSITPSGPTTFCNGGSVTLTATSGSSYLWNNGATTQNITVTTQGTYSVTVTDAGGCIGNQSQQVSVTSPSVQITGDNVVCSGQPIVLTASSSGSGNSYLWSTGSTSQSINVTQSGEYTVTVTTNGCTAASSPKVITQSQTVTPSVTISTPKTTICAGEDPTFTATPVNGGNPTYLWKIDGGTTFFTGNPYTPEVTTDTDVFTVEMTSSLSCVTERTVISNPITMTVVTCPVGIGTTDDETISIYPNPAINEIKIEAGKEKIERIRIFNATGVLVKSIVADLITIDVSGLASGIYFLEIKFQDASRRYKFAKM